MWSKPLFNTCDLLGSLSKEIIEALFLTELIAPPTMTDETEPTIAGVTFLHAFPRGLAANVVSLPESSRKCPASEVARGKFPSCVIAAQLPAQRLTIMYSMPVEIVPLVSTYPAYVC